jgi:RNA polymerase sporulation-specific sigma factor
VTLAVGSDDALALRAGAGDEWAFGELADRYRGLIGLVSRRPPSGLSRDDLRQEALIGLFEACRAHDPGKGAFAQMAGACVRHRVWRARRHARRAKHRVLTDALGLDHRDGPAGDGEQLTIAERLPARDGVDPALVVEWRERLAELAAAAKALTPGYREALLGEGSVTARRRWHARRRLEELLDQGATVAPARVDGRLYSEQQVQHAVALVADGKSLRQAGAAVGAAGTTVLGWLRKAA